MNQHDTSPSSILDLIPFAVELGIELVEAGPELVRGRLQWAPERTTTADVMHGGAIMALADTCGGLCAFLNLGCRHSSRCSPATHTG